MDWEDFIEYDFLLEDDPPRRRPSPGGESGGCGGGCGMPILILLVLIVAFVSFG